MHPTPYVILNNQWHKVSITDASKLECGLDTPAESEISPQGKPRPLICEGCKQVFPYSSVEATHTNNLNIWKAAISAGVTEERREEVMRFHKLAVAESRAAGIAEERSRWLRGEGK
jgi:hypothetical protein